MKLKLLFFLLTSLIINSQCADMSDDNLTNFNYHQIVSMLESNDINGILQCLNNGLDVNQIISSKSLLNFAASEGSIDVAELLIMRGADVNLISQYPSPHWAWTPLHCAVRWNQIEFVKLLLMHNADPNLKNLENRTPLYYAFYYSRTEIINLLLEYRAILDKHLIEDLGGLALIEEMYEQELGPLLPKIRELLGVKKNV